VIEQILIKGYVHRKNAIRATGGNGRIQSLIVEGTLDGHVFSNNDIDNLQARHLGSQATRVGGAKFEGIYAGRNIGTLTVDGDVRSTASVRVREDLEFLNIGEDVLEGASIVVNDQILRRQIGGQVFGDILVGRPT
jgi:hypothetical protein